MLLCFIHDWCIVYSRFSDKCQIEKNKSIREFGMDIYTIKNILNIKKLKCF